MKTANSIHKQKRDASILNDYRRFFNDGLRQEVIYQRLSDKYYLAESSLVKIVRSEARKTK